MYYVEGGVFKTTEFKDVCEGTEECYGPFPTYEQALEAWKRHTFTGMLDTCTHRLLINQKPE